jgi:hypothetical protein
LSTQYASLTQQIAAYQAQRDAAVLAATSKDVPVTAVNDPSSASSVSALRMRYVPATVVVALGLCLLVVAGFAKRRPWLTSPQLASEILGVPLVAVGKGSGGRPGMAASGGVGYLTGVAVERNVPNSMLRRCVFVPVPRGRRGQRSSSIFARTRQLADEVVGVLERRGTKVALAEVGPGGIVRFVGADHAVEPLGEGEGTTSVALVEVGTALSIGVLDADMVLVIPEARLEREVLLNLLSLGDGAVLVVASGTAIASLLQIRRELEVIGRQPIGVVVDP